MSIHILIHDPSDLVVLGASSILQADYRYQVSGSSDNVDALIPLINRLLPDVVVIGESFDEGGLWVTVERVRRAMPNLRIIALGSRTNGRHLHALLRLGVRGYLHTADELARRLPIAVDWVMRGHRYFSPTAHAAYFAALQGPDRRWRLDNESRTVLDLMATGCTASAIADQLRLPIRRVYWVQQKLRNRFDAVTNAHLISRAIAEQFTTASES